MGITRRKQSINVTNKRSPENCTRTQRKIIYGAIKAKLPLSRAAMLAGTTIASLHKWLRFGTEATRPKKYYYFRKKVYRLRAENEKQALAIIDQMAKGGSKLKELKISIGGKNGKEITKTTKTLAPQWQAAAWFLERTLPDEYAYKKREENASRDASDIAKEIQEAMSAMDESIPEEEDSDDDE